MASDVSGAMLAYAATLGRQSDAAAIEYLEASATDLGVADGPFDVVVCQQGLPFFSDRPGAAAAMHGSLRAGGVAGVAVWARGHRLEPFDDYAEALTAAGIDPPFPRACETSSFVMGADEVEALLTGAGFSSVEVSVIEHTIVWPDSKSAAAGILGTPFGPVVHRFPPTAVRRSTESFSVALPLARGSPCGVPRPPFSLAPSPEAAAHHVPRGPAHRDLPGVTAGSAVLSCEMSVIFDCGS